MTYIKWNNFFFALILIGLVTFCTNHDYHRDNDDFDDDDDDDDNNKGYNVADKIHDDNKDGKDSRKRP